MVEWWGGGLVGWGGGGLVQWWAGGLVGWWSPTYTVRDGQRRVNVTLVPFVHLEQLRGGVIVEGVHPQPVADRGGHARA